MRKISDALPAARSLSNSLRAELLRFGADLTTQDCEAIMAKVPRAPLQGAKRRGHEKHSERSRRDRRQVNA
jgi:hypothetical protein